MRPLGTMKAFWFNYSSVNTFRQKLSKIRKRVCLTLPKKENIFSSGGSRNFEIPERGAHPSKTAKNTHVLG
jgi:hypothetical protein